MAKPRKMLGSIENPTVKALMALMETQRKETLARWAAAEAKRDLLLMEDAETKAVLARALTAAESCAGGETTLPALKPLLREAAAAARAMEESPVSTAAAKAVATAAAVMQTPTNALGWLFYHAAVQAYQALGVNAERQALDEAAEKLMQEALSSLQACAVPQEPCPVKLNWGC